MSHRSESQKRGNVKCMTDAEIRLRNSCKTIEKIKHLEAYSVDTKNLKYAPRLLKIGSKEWPTLDHAFRHIKANHGGYVLELCRPHYEYSFSESLCDNEVDDLVILGDPNPFAGVSYVNHYRLDVIDNNRILSIPEVNEAITYIPCTKCEGTGGKCSDSLLCKDVNPQVAHYGKGPFRISYAGNGAFTVNSIHGDSYNPDFSCIPRGTGVAFIANAAPVASVTGLIHGRVVNGMNNVITIEMSNDLNGNAVSIDVITRRTARIGEIEAGNGFVFLPDRTIVATKPNATIQTQKSLKIVGVNIRNKNQPFTFLHCVHGSVVLNNCHGAGPIAIRGNFYFDAPNIYTNTLVIWDTARGEAYCQTFFGQYAHLQAQPGSSSMWNMCYFIYCASAAEAIGADISFPNSSFISCCMAFSATGGSRASLPNTTFANNNYAIIAIYNSDVFSIPVNIPGASTEQLPAGPWFLDNLVMIIAYFSSHVILPTTGGANNVIPFIIDGKVYTTIESNPVGNYNQNFSVVNIFPNPFTPNPRLLGCPGVVDSASLGEMSSWGIATPSGIEFLVNASTLLYANSQQTIDRSPEIISRDNNDRENWLVGSNTTT